MRRRRGNARGRRRDDGALCNGPAEPDAPRKGDTAAAGPRVGGSGGGDRSAARTPPDPPTRGGRFPIPASKRGLGRGGVLAALRSPPPRPNPRLEVGRSPHL